MNKTLALAISTSLLISGYASAATSESTQAAANPAITQAETDVKKAQSSSVEWRMLDKAAGKAAQDLNKVLKIAKKKQAAGEVEEATRLAKKISTFVMLAFQQAEQQKDAKPHY